MTAWKIDDIGAAILERALPDGGFSSQPDGRYSTDCTAWAVIALAAEGNAGTDAVKGARKRLAAHQTDAGSIPMLDALQAACWPTAPVLLAWAGDERYNDAAQTGVTFLLNIRSQTFPYSGAPEDGHDSTIVGWPWVENTYAWVVPSALAMMALDVYGETRHERMAEARSLLLSRQLPSGGWNYGDTYKFGTELLPFPDTTAMALEAISGLCATEAVEKSLVYLNDAVPGIRSPVSLPWAILGLSSWSQRPPRSTAWLEECLARQEVFGPYDTDLLAFIAIAHRAKRGLKDAIRKQMDVRS